jgi:hypothetical protein
MHSQRSNVVANDGTVNGFVEDVEDQAVRVPWKQNRRVLLQMLKQKYTFVKGKFKCKLHVVRQTYAIVAYVLGLRIQDHSLREVSMEAKDSSQFLTSQSRSRNGLWH